MTCLFCGTELGLTSLFGDRDFCLPSHRRKYHDRLRKGMTQIEEPEIELPELTEFLVAPTLGMPPANRECQPCSIAPVAAPFRSRQPDQPGSQNIRPVAPDLPQAMPEESVEPAASVLQFVAPVPPPRAAEERTNPRSDLASRLNGIRADLQRKRLRPAVLAAC